MPGSDAPFKAVTSGRTCNEQMIGTNEGEPHPLSAHLALSGLPGNRTRARCCIPSGPLEDLP